MTNPEVFWKLIEVIEGFTCCSSECCGHPEKSAALKIVREILQDRHYDRFIQDRLDSILARPKMWGSNEAVELQVLQLLDFLAFHRLEDCPPRFVLDRYAKFLQSHKLLGTKPLSQHFENVEDITRLLGEFRRQIEAEILPSIEIVQPVGNCDGSGKYRYDSSQEDGRGELLKQPCPGCRACQ